MDWNERAKLMRKVHLVKTECSRLLDGLQEGDPDWGPLAKAVDDLGQAIPVIPSQSPRKD